ncbi:hypothetical protein V8E54_001623 [Elaphomyces granulatus]
MATVTVSKRRSGITSSSKAARPTSSRKRTRSEEQPGQSKRKKTTASSGRLEVIDLTGDDDPVPATIPSPSKKRKRTASSDAAVPERRARRFRRAPPQTYLEKLARATTQRMYVLNRTRSDNEEILEEVVDIVGTTGNVYKVKVNNEPTCSCPDAAKGNQCKHIIYVGAVLVNVLKAPSHLRYQLAFLTSELCEIFEKAPIKSKEAEATDSAGKRKAIEGDCPICFMEFDSQNEEIVWCKAACGNNIHKACFDRWAATQRAQGVRCVYCRTPWAVEEDSRDLQSLLSKGRVNEEGYVNVASELGMSGIRGMTDLPSPARRTRILIIVYTTIDHSTYHQPWGYRRFSRFY